MDRSYGLYGLWSVFWLDGQELGRNVIGTLVLRRSGEYVFGLSSLNRKQCEDICVTYKSSPNVTLSGESFNKHDPFWTRPVLL